MSGPIFYVIIVILVIAWIGTISMVIKMYKKAKPGEALVKTGIGGSKVSFQGILVVPFLHNLERLDITVKTYELNKSGENHLLTRDGRKLEIATIFYLRINQTEQAVIQVAQAFGSDDVSSPEFIERNFGKKFEEAIINTVYAFKLDNLLSDIGTIKMEIMDTIGTDLNGFILDDVAIHHLKELTESHITQPLKVISQTSK